MNILTRRLLSIIVMVLVWDACAWLRAADVVGPSVTELTIEQAAKLVVEQGDLDLSDLHVLSPQVAALLARSTGSIQLNGLASLSPESAAALSQPDAFLELDGLIELPLDTARALITATNPRALTLRGLRSITDEVAELMGQHSGYRDWSPSPTDRLNCSPHTGDFSGSPA